MIVHVCSAQVVFLFADRQHGLPGALLALGKNGYFDNHLGPPPRVGDLKQKTRLLRDGLIRTVRVAGRGELHDGSLLLPAARPEPRGHRQARVSY